MAVVYRLGSAGITQLFFSENSELLGDLASLAKSAYIIGDFNVRLDRKDDEASRQLDELFTTHNFVYQKTDVTHAWVAC